MMRVHCILTYYGRLNELNEFVYLYAIAALKRNRVRIVKLRNDILRRVRRNLGKSDKKFFVACRNLHFKRLIGQNT